MIESIEWISVDDEMPDDDCTVLVVDKDGDVQTAFRIAGAWESSIGWFPVGVTHWAHMPVGPGGHS